MAADVYNRGVEPVTAVALSGLLQLLCCGEQSAGPAFELLSRRRARAGDSEQLVGQLRGIAAEEQQHEQLLEALLASLPRSPPVTGAAVHASRFFRGLASPDAGTHFTRIAALDSAVCLLLSALRKAQPRLFHPALARIASDEARHAAIASHYARRLATPALRLAAASETRNGLANLLAAHAGNLEVLGLDPSRVLARIAMPPRFLRS